MHLLLSDSWLSAFFMIALVAMASEGMRQSAKSASTPFYIYEIVDLVALTSIGFWIWIGAARGEFTDTLTGILGFVGLLTAIGGSALLIGLASLRWIPHFTKNEST